jgi:hypothetical protein
MMSRFYEVEVVVIHMRNLHVETFGSDQDAQNRMYLMFDGDKYNLCMNYHPTSGDKIYQFDPTDEYVY